MEKHHALVNMTKIHQKVIIEGLHIEFKLIDCNCVDCKGLYAFVIPVATPGPRKIFLGPHFFQASNVVFWEDSKVATILHELSHFRDICATKDISYDSRDSFNVSSVVRFGFNELLGAGLVISTCVPIIANVARKAGRKRSLFVNLLQ